MPPPEEAAEAPALLEEILEEIILRIPPYDPARLVRFSLASKFWLAHLSSPRFRGRYRERHGEPPMLGFLNSTPWDSTEPEEAAPPFVSTTAFRARVPGGGWGRRDYTAWDCRHGRVLLGENNAPLEESGKLAVWDPLTGRRWELQEPEVVFGYGLYAAAVLCAASGCDHLACHERPTRVVHLSLHKICGDDFVAQARVSSAETWGRSNPYSEFHPVEWSDPCPGVSVGGDGYIEPRPPVLLNHALHFLLAHDSHDVDEIHHYEEILKYDLSSNCLSLIDAPPKAGADIAAVSVLMATEGGNLGFARLKKFTFFIWSRDVGSDGVAAWTRHRVVDLKSLIPILNPGGGIRLLGSVEGSEIVFVTTHAGIYKINLKSLQQKKISNGEYLVSLIPFMGFYNPRGHDASVIAPYSHTDLIPTADVVGPFIKHLKRRVRPCDAVLDMLKERRPLSSARMMTNFDATWIF